MREGGNKRKIKQQLMDMTPYPPTFSISSAIADKMPMKVRRSLMLWRRGSSDSTKTVVLGGSMGSGWWPVVMWVRS